MTANVYDLYRVGSDGKSLVGFKVSHGSVSDFNDAVISKVGANNIARTPLAQSLLGKSTAADMRKLINAREDKTLTSNDISDFDTQVESITDSKLTEFAQVLLKILAPVRHTASEFTTINTILNNGQIGIETDTNRIKIGDGKTAWKSLSYVTVEDTLTFASN